MCFLLKTFANYVHLNLIYVTILDLLICITKNYKK